MTYDELADAFRLLLDELHDKIEAEQQPLKHKARRLAKLMHGAADALKELGVDHHVIRPDSGGDPKPPQPGP